MGVIVLAQRSFRFDCGFTRQALAARTLKAAKGIGESPARVAPSHCKQSPQASPPCRSLEKKREGEKMGEGKRRRGGGGWQLTGSCCEFNVQSIVYSLKYAVIHIIVFFSAVSSQ